MEGMEEKIRLIVDELEKLESEMQDTKKREKLSNLINDLYVISELLRYGLEFRVDASGIRPDFHVLSTDQIYVEFNDSLTLKEIRESLQQKTLQQLPRLLSEAVALLHNLLREMLKF